jgi:hypothetical protein
VNSPIEQDKFFKYIRGIKLAFGLLMHDFIGSHAVFVLIDENIPNVENLLYCSKCKLVRSAYVILQMQG